MLGGNRKNLILTTGLGSVVLGTALPGPKRSGTGWRPGPQQTLSPASPAQAAWQRRGWAVAANSDASELAIRPVIRAPSGGDPALRHSPSCCLSAAGIRFPGTLSRQGLPPLLRSACRPAGTYPCLPGGPWRGFRVPHA
jgi:hypothetical protein